MSAIYTIQAKNINQAALFFAERGYHVTTSFCSNNNDMDVTVFFHQCDDRKLIESFMNRFKDKDDLIEYDEFTRDNGDKFYTLTLSKQTS